MARILVNGEWYEEVAPTSLYEFEFEQIVIEQAPLVYPEYHVVPFKPLVYSENGAAKPDLALIDKEYREWWVIEVEMGHHSLNSHVLPQVRILSSAVYSEQEAKYLCQKLPDLDLGRTTDMMKGKQPRVLVIINTQRPNWVQPLAKYEAILTVFEMFCSDKNRHIFRIDGEHPVQFLDIVSECFFDPILPRFLTVESPAGLGVSHCGKVTIRYDDQITEWERVDVQDKVWLSPVGANPLSTNCKYELLRNSDGSSMFRSQDS